jgi:hypothetical protein
MCLQPDFVARMGLVCVHLCGGRAFVWWMLICASVMLICAKNSKGEGPVVGLRPVTVGKTAVVVSNRDKRCQFTRSNDRCVLRLQTTVTLKTARYSSGIVELLLLLIHRERPGVVRVDLNRFGLSLPALAPPRIFHRLTGMQ